MCMSHADSDKTSQTSVIDMQHMYTDRSLFALWILTHDPGKYYVYSYSL